MSRHEQRGKAFRFAGILICALGLTYFGFALAEHYRELPGSLFSRASIGPVVLGIALAFCIYLLLSLTVRWLWADMGSRLPYIRVFEVTLITQIAKYIPGNIGHLVGRVAVATRYGATPALVSIAILYETIWAIGVGVVLGVPAFLVTPRAADLGLPLELSVLLVLLLPLGIGIPWVIECFARLVPRATSMLGIHDMNRPRAQTILSILVVYFVIFCIWGIVCFVLMHEHVKPDAFSALYFFGIVAFALVAGFFVPGAPAGLGVRESVLLIGLGPVFGEAEVLAMTILFRLVTIANDLLCFFVGLGLHAISARTAGARAGPTRRGTA